MATIQPPLVPHITNPLTRERSHSGRDVPILSVELLDGADHLELICSPKALGSGQWANLQVFSFPTLETIESDILDVGRVPDLSAGRDRGGDRGTFDHAAKMAKKGILRPVDERHEEPEVRALEDRLLRAVNELGFGPMGTGGDLTTVAVNVEYSAGHGFTRSRSASTARSTARRAPHLRRRPRRVAPMSGARNDSPRRITLPMSEAEARSLHAGEMVLVDGECTITAGIPTMDRMLRCLDDGQPFPIDLDGGSITHVGSLSRDTPDGLELLYMNPTTSTRFNPDMPRLIRELRLHAVGGKGGLDAESRIAMQEVGCVYLGLLGGGSVLLSDAVTDVVSVHWVDLVPHYRLVAIKVRDLGPLAAAVDAHGNSIYKQLADNAREWAAGILVALAHQRGSS